MARPRKTVDALAVIQLASKGLTQEEIAASLNICVDTLTDRFPEELKKGKFLCNSSLRKKQYDVAMHGSVPMLMWLGKNRLDQKDTEEKQVGGNTFNLSIVNLIERPTRNIDVPAIPEAASIPSVASEV